MAELAHVGGRHRAVAHHVEQRLAVDKLHGEVRTADARVDGEHVVSHDRVMRQAVEDRRFLADQRQDRLVVRVFGQHDLDRNVIARLDVVAAVNLAHAARSKALVELVDAAELGASGRRADIRQYLRLVAAHRRQPVGRSVQTLNKSLGDIVGPPSAARKMQCAIKVLDSSRARTRRQYRCRR